ncbi:MAG TPA: crosslink repair DNA glycosylase YcaQ family protein [Terriglobia bacterium]|nr:crosslink repair DNA glycosylase YcaQ family protein [Terriglobia bacterium]
MAMLTLERLRAHAISQSLFPQTTLKAAIRRLGFVQADPIRSPARAQDLILRHRVKAYRAGDLERRYASLDIEEDVLYAYGFLSRTIWQLLHPRNLRGMSKLEKKVLDVVCRFGAMHPRELEAHFGKARVINAWGGYSKATTHALDHLHYRGLLRIARRENGIRVYEAAPSPREPMSPTERLRKLVMAIANILAPVPERSLHANIARYRGLGNPRAILNDLLDSGELEKQMIDGITYLWPHSGIAHEEAPRSVRFLAPFDPLVWDRQRFEHLWRWPYRFEAYTPAAKRLRGYYAMPILWCDSVIGWANARVEGKRLNVEVGFVEKRPRDSDFQSELDAEIGRLETFLRLK